jgi:hypothetical protein
LQKSIKYCLILLVWLYCIKSFGQEPKVTKNTKNQGVKLLGAISLNSSYNTGIQQYSTPFNYFVSGTINLKINELNIPITGNYSDRTFKYALPYDYNYLSINPRYKWIMANIGTNFMQFSPYSLNGHQYKGAGIQLSPGKWQIKGMNGRLFKANESNDSLAITANYKRTAKGAKIKYNGDIIKVGLSVFEAKDDINSIITTKILPLAKQNLIISTEFGINFSKHLAFNFEYATSGIVENLGSKLADSKVTNSYLGKFLPKNPSLRTANALKSSISYIISETSSIVGLQYERVDPNYTTLGGYYFVNDFENITLQVSQPLFERKMYFSGNLGFQRDDLAYKKSSNQRRIVGSTTINFMPSSKFNTSLSYSNFTAYSNIRSAFDEIRKQNPFDQLDTLNYRQITQNVNSNMNVELGKKERESHQLNTMVSWMLSANKQGDFVRLGQLSTFTNGSLSYSYQHKDKYFGFSTGINLSNNTIGRENNRSIGPIFNLRKGFFKNKLQTNINAAQIYTQDQIINKVGKFSNFRFYTTLRLQKGHVFSLNTGYNVGTISNGNKREYLSAMLGYQLRF